MPCYRYHDMDGNLYWCLRRTKRNFSRLQEHPTCINLQSLWIIATEEQWKELMEAKCRWFGSWNLDLHSSILCNSLVTTEPKLQWWAEIMLLGGRIKIHLKPRTPLGYREAIQKEKTSFEVWRIQLLAFKIKNNI